MKINYFFFLFIINDFHVFVWAFNFSKAMYVETKDFYFRNKRFLKLSDIETIYLFFLTEEFYIT